MGLPFDGRLLLHSLFSRFSAFPPQAPIPFPFRLLRTLLQSSKSQLFCFQAIPQSLCNTPGVGGVHPAPMPTIHGRPAKNAFIGFVTCPEGVHRTYYWNRRATPPSYPQVTVPSFPIAWEGAMGKFSRSWQLVKQSFAILRSDKQLMLFPVLSAVSCFVVTAIIATGGAFLMLPARAAAIAAGERFNPNQSPMFLIGLFTVYVVNYFVIVFFNVALVGVANSRLMGGPWTFRDGLELAWERKGTILQWALVAATVGVILRTVEERLGLIGRIIIRIIGFAWTLACYFVVPVLAFEDLTPIDAVKRSSKLFRDTWGEKVIGGFSLSLVSLVLMLPGIGLLIAATFVGGLNGLLVGLLLMVLYFLLLSVFMSAVGGIFNAALYRYACFKQVPPAFSHDLIASAWAPKS